LFHGDVRLFQFPPKDPEKGIFRSNHGRFANKLLEDLYKGGEIFRIIFFASLCGLDGFLRIIHCEFIAVDSANQVEHETCPILEPA
jgi:hypothetical protein